MTTGPERGERTCSTCRWWDPRRFHPDHPGAGQCEFVDTIRSSGRAAGHKTFTVEVTAADDHGLNVRLMTGPEFGCVHHQDRPTANRSDNARL